MKNNSEDNYTTILEFVGEEHEFEELVWVVFKCRLG